MLQRITAAGTVAPGWPGRGVPVAADAFPGEFWPTLYEDRPRIAGDGKGGSFVVWTSGGREPGRSDVHLQRVAGNGRIARRWPEGGKPIAVGVGPGYQYRADLVSDAAGGVYVSWLEEPEERCSRVVRLDASGAPAPGWEGGRKIASLQGVVLAQDARAGVFASWVDETWTESEGSRFHPRVLRLPAEPILAGAESATVGDAHGDSVGLTLVADGTGGTFGVWQEAGRFSPSAPLDGGAPALPRVFSFAFAPPRPNPATDAVAIEFEIPSAGPVDVTVFDIAGRVTRSLARPAPLAPGPHRIRWSLDGRDRRRVAAGVYLVRVTAGEHVATHKLVVVP